MSFKIFSIVKCIIVLGLVSDYGHSRHHSGIYYHYHQYKHNRKLDHHWHQHAPLLNFEIHKPKGLMVSTIQRSPNTTFFGIQIYVNKVPSNNATPCDICLNTTKVTYGKFIVEDEEAVIKKGDVLYYRILFGSNKNVTRMQLQKLLVTDSIINKCNCEEKVIFPKLNIRFGEPDVKPNQPPMVDQKLSLAEVRYPTSSTKSIFESEENEHRNEPFSQENDVSFECDPDPSSNLCQTPKSVHGATLKLMQSLRDYEREIQVLESIIDQMKIPCGAKRVTNILQLKMPSWETVSNKEQAMNVIRTSLSFNSSDMRELDSKIRLVVAVSDSKGRSITFEMPSYVEKQKVLYHARLNKLEQIVDYDCVKRG